ncbi:hypothetical protein D3C71_1522470 [compost metagenome]
MAANFLDEFWPVDQLNVLIFDIDVVDGIAAGQGVGLQNGGVKLLWLRAHNLRTVTRIVGCRNIFGLDRFASRLQTLSGAQFRNAGARTLKIPSTIPAFNKVLVDFAKYFALHANGVVTVGFAMPHAFFPGNAR